MPKRIIITEDPLDVESWYAIDDVPNVAATLMEHFPEWPETARIYHEYVSQATDVTPFDEHSVAALETLEGDIFIVVYPGKTIFLVILAVVALVAITVLLQPKIPDISQRNQQAGSPNNELSARENRPRLNGRIPDIYGIARSTPDLIAPIFNYYEGNRKVEVSYMCVGRGEHTIYDVRDADTLLAHVPGSSAAFYGPNTSPTNSAPFYSVGAAIEEPLVRARKLEQVVGQELRPPNSATVTGASNIKFQFPDRIYNSVGINFQDKFVADDQVSIVGATFTGPSGSISVNAIARYVNGGYVEWQSDDPRNHFEVGDSLQISGSTKTMVKDTFTETWTGQARFRDNGRIYFDNGGGDNPIDLGEDFRANKDFTLTGAVFNYNFQGTYTITNKTSTVLTLSNPASVNADWNAINGQTEYKTVTIAGIARSVRFVSPNQIELQSGNFNDINFPSTTTVVVGSDAAFSTDLNGTYQFTTSSSSLDYWALNNPSGVTAEWNEINGYTGYATVTIQQTHVGDTESRNFNGTYVISSMTADRIYLTNPGTVNVVWNELTQYVNDRSEYSDTDTFFVSAPVRSINLNGTYTIVSVGLYEIILSNPSAVSTDWGKLDFFAGNEVTPAAPTIATTGGNFIGPFFLDNPSITKVYNSFIAPNGLYKDDGKNQTRAQVEVEVQFYPATSAGVATGAAPQIVSMFLTGSAVQKDTIAATMKTPLIVHGYQLMYARRLTPKDTAFAGSVIDTVKWEETFIFEPETKTHFGNVTTVQTKTYATGGALALKERKLNCLVGRKINIVTGFSGTYPNVTPIYAADKQVSDDAAQVFLALSLDPHFGGRSANELDFYGIIASKNMVSGYFGDVRSTKFSYTFDNTNISYEEAASAIANAAFCVAYRQGNLIKWKPELSTSNSTILFNHRNKIPGSETRTVRFGAHNDHDSIQLEWVNPDDDSVETFFIPEDQSGVRPKKIETIGIRNIAQATWHAWRSFYKTKYQNTTVEFDATQEASILIHRDRVLVADNTRADTQDGEIWDQEVLQLTLSQEVILDNNQAYTIFIQHVDGTVEGIPCTPVPDNIVGLVKNTTFLPEGGIKWTPAADVGKLAVGDQVTMTVTSFAHPTFGTTVLDGTYTVAAVDGIAGIILFDNPIAVTTHWARIDQEYTRNGVNFNATKNSRRKVNLQYAPKLPLSLDPENYSKATYVIRGSSEVAPQAFMVQEVRPKDNFTFSVSVTNYDPRFYYLDELEFWLNFDDQTFRDASARAHTVSISTATSKAVISFDAERQSYTHDNPTGGSQAWVQSSTLTGGGSYTKAAWVRHAGGFDAYFLSNANEQFRCNGSNRLICSHGATTLTYVGFPSNLNEWHHIACTYDAASQTIRLFLDGVLVAQRVSVPAASAAILQPVGLSSSVGIINRKCDDVRYWRRAFSPQEVSELYNATR